jgi:hypothetical protein
MVIDADGATVAPVPEDPDGGTVEVVPQTGRWSSMLLFFETKVGSTLLAFALTGILGAIITNQLTEAQRRHDEELARLKDDQVRWEALSDFVSSTINQRAVDATLVASALRRPAAASEIDERWTNYQTSYRTYNIAIYKNRRSLRDMGPNSNKAIFATYIDHSLTPGFASVDNCLTKAHDNYILAKGNSVLRSKSATDVLDKCWDGQIPADYNARSRDLRGCLTTFQDELDWVIRLKRQVEEQEMNLGSQPSRFFKGMYIKSRGCNYDAVCRQKNDYDNLAATLKKGCADSKAASPSTTSFSSAAAARRRTAS